MIRHAGHGGPNPAFEVLVRRDVFAETTPEERARLRSPEHLERFASELMRTVSGVHDQLQNRGVDADPGWRDAALLIERKYNVRLAEVRQLSKLMRDRWTLFDPVALKDEVDRLRGAIRKHQYGREAADEEHDDIDEELWAHVITDKETRRRARRKAEAQAAPA